LQLPRHFHQFCSGSSAAGPVADILPTAQGEAARQTLNRHCERSEAIQCGLGGHWIAASLRSSQ
jgi:hypothetical protein